MDYKEKLRDLITLSDLDIHQKTLWDLFLKISYGDEDEAVFEAVSDSEKNLRLLSKHLKDKITWMKDNNPELWDLLTDGEKRYLEVA